MKLIFFYLLATVLKAQRLEGPRKKPEINKINTTGLRNTVATG